MKTAERAPLDQTVYNYVYQRCYYAYVAAQSMISGKVFEIGTGDGIGVDLMSALCEEFTTIDKFDCGFDFTKYPNTSFRQMEVPPFSGIPSDYYDYVISFQVIEHIEDDHLFVQEISRVLKPGGTAILTTPNILQTLSRNPWHVREYTAQQLQDILKPHFSKVECQGVYGNEKVKRYIDHNRASVNKLMRWDIFDLQHKLPRRWLQLPYDLLNSYNRKKLSSSHQDLSAGIKASDFHHDQATDLCLDLMMIATK